MQTWMYIIYRLAEIQSKNTTERMHLIHTLQDFLKSVRLSLLKTTKMRLIFIKSSK
uniref:Uncharacterized protein n=1 Tax=Medicago truncatula TaxID=3880 RepID=I3SPJ2_MEDTR|nr:unknown [Medicago truncatula]